MAVYGFFSLPLWAEVLLLILAGIGFGFLVLALSTVASDLWAMRGTDDELWRYEREREASRVAIPYYVDQTGLRTLASGLKIELPLATEVTRGRRWSVTLKGLFGERSHTEKAQFTGEINLSELSLRLREELGGALVENLALAPPAGEEGFLESIFGELNDRFGGRPEVRETLIQFQEVFREVRQETIARQKAADFEQAGETATLVLLQGTFKECDSSASAAERPSSIELTHLMAPPFVPSYSWRYESELQRPVVSEIPVPAGVDLRVALPDAKALTAAGRERITRGHPFHGSVIAHSPSYEERTGRLVCAAYAVWAVPREGTYGGLGC